jgi:hypothetical protein
MKFSVSWQQTKEKKTRKEGPERREKKNKVFHKKAYKDSRLIKCTRKDSIRETKFNVSSAFVSALSISLLPRSRERGERCSEQNRQRKREIRNRLRSGVCSSRKSHNSGHMMNPATKSPLCNWKKP